MLGTDNGVLKLVQYNWNIVLQKKVVFIDKVLNLVLGEVIVESNTEAVFTLEGVVHFQTAIHSATLNFVSR